MNRDGLYGYLHEVVVRQGLESVRVIAEGPEPVQMHIGTLFQRHAGHDQPGAGPRCSEALGLPEEGQILKTARKHTAVLKLNEKAGRSSRALP
ncbi:hypothetical protein EYF80_003756 [Liparis tanakae]|uniref:Uncharacterized protein n=1 Tax=Liparis tanakae TaxID=230148 RepID=A0A4Z2J8X0_9TELE|nr:hypothetical protein EYF80_003756 [Liparis tanakae]